MNVYISSHDQPAALALSETLAGHGHGIAARWITDDVNIHGASDEIRTGRVLDNLKDIDGADALVVISAPKGEMVPGGKHFETGYAVAKGKKVYAIDRRENLYQWHPSVEVVQNEAELVAKLGG